jgi:hypothetical protein
VALGRESESLTRATYCTRSHLTKTIGERFYWLGRAASRSLRVEVFCAEVSTRLPSFEAGKDSRILHAVAPFIRRSFGAANRTVFGRSSPVPEHEKLQRVVELHDAMLERARRAMACFSIVGRRCGLVRDVRVMICRLAWEEVWRWSSEKKQVRDEGAYAQWCAVQ